MPRECVRPDHSLSRWASFRKCRPDGQRQECGEQTHVKDPAPDKRAVEPLRKYVTQHLRLSHPDDHRAPEREQRYTDRYILRHPPCQYQKCTQCLADIAGHCRCTASKVDSQRHRASPPLSTHEARISGLIGVGHPASPPSAQRIRRPGSAKAW